MRPITSCASSTAETFFAASAADSSVALPKLHCDLAKASLPDFVPDAMMLSSGAGRKPGYRLMSADGSYPGSIRCITRLR
jgi:hypothetical protein